MDAGLAVVLVEAPLDLQQTLTVPEDHWQACDASNTLKMGNAAGSTENVYDLTGANTSVSPLPAGFTARGIVALVFSCIAALLGLISIVWYVYFLYYIFSKPYSQRPFTCHLSGSNCCVLTGILGMAWHRLQRNNRQPMRGGKWIVIKISYILGIEYARHDPSAI